MLSGSLYNQISEKEFGIIARTMIEVFPLVALWRADFLGSRYVALLMGHKDESAR